MYIIHIGYSGFPTGNATIQRIRLTFKGLKLAGCNPLIINKHSISQSQNTRHLNRFQGIPYLLTSFSPNRPDSFIKRTLNKFSGYIGEFVFLFKKRKKIHTAIFYESSFTELFYYRILSKILRFKLIIQYVELRSAIPERQNFFNHLNDKLFDNYSFHFCDGIIVISEFLKNRSLSKVKSLPLIKIPAICDFEEFDTDADVYPQNFLMYCGTIAYFPVIEFIVDLFSKLKKLNLYDGNLLLAIGGNKDSVDFKRLEKKIIGCGYSDSIILNKNVPHKNLIELYLSAEILIVPLRNTFQDIAGFHHKVGEYSATKKPIVSTNIGELAFYFKDRVSAILANEYSIESYIEKFAEKSLSKDRLTQIGQEGFKVGSTKLNYKICASELKEFIMSI